MDKEATDFMKEFSKPVPLQYGNWRIRLDNLTIEHVNTYYVDLERCQTSSDVLDWIFQIQGKGVGGRWHKEDVGDLVDALQAALDPQANLIRLRDPLKITKEFVKKNLRIP